MGQKGKTVKLSDRRETVLVLPASDRPAEIVFRGWSVDGHAAVLIRGPEGMEIENRRVQESGLPTIAESG